MPRSIAKSRLEALLSIATGAAAEPLAGLAGLYGAARGGSGEGVRMIDKVRGKLTYQPRDPRGQQEIATALGPIMQKIEAGKAYLGDGAFNKTGSPALAAAAYTAPDALLSLLGARPALAAGRSASRGLGRAVARSAALPAPSMGSPAAQLGIFAGRNAKTADHGAMQRAAARLARGDDPRAVWREEGWMKGPDGHMRFEIDDSASAPAPPTWGQREDLRQGNSTTATRQRALLHPGLSAAYPESKLIGVRLKPEYGGGSYSEDPFPQITAGADPYSGKANRSTMLHELQHSVQSREGFARGGTPGSAVAAAQAQEFNTDVYSPHDLYERLAGEAEARAVQTRADYTPQQRRDVYPLDDYDVPLDELIFRGQSDGPQMAIRRALPESGLLVTPNTPTPEQMQRSSRIENVPLGDQVRSPQRELRWDKFDAGNSPGALVEGYGDMPVAVRLRNGEYLIYDGNHRTIKAMDGGATSMRMHVIDAADFDPEAAGRAPAPQASIAEDEALLAELLGKR